MAQRDENLPQSGHAYRDMGWKVDWQEPMESENGRLLIKRDWAYAYVEDNQVSSKPVAFDKVSEQQEPKRNMQVKIYSGLTGKIIEGEIKATNVPRLIEREGKKTYSSVISRKTWESKIYSCMEIAALLWILVKQMNWLVSIWEHQKYS